MSIDKKYKLYVFDFDGTLIDTRTDIARTFQVFLGEFGYPEPSLDEVRSAIGGGAKQAIAKLCDMSESDIDKNLDRFLELYAQLCADNTTIYEGGEELVRRLKSEGALLAVITMKAKIPTMNIIKKHKLESLFDDVISYDDVEKRKPDPQSMNLLLEKYGLSPGDALMIGDTVVDLRFAKAAGVDAVAMTYGYGKTDEVLAEKPQYLLDSFLDF